MDIVIIIILVNRDNYNHLVSAT